MTPCTCGVLHPSDMDRMAHDLADHIIETSVITSVGLACEKAVIESVTKRHRPRRHVDFESYYRFLAPYEGRLKRGLSHVWTEQRQTIVGNMKRTPKGHGATIRKDGMTVIRGLAFAELFEQWAFAKGPANKALQVVYKDLATKLMVASALRENKLWDLTTNWDVFNPNIEKWLKTYSIDLADEINTQTLDKLKGSLFEGWEKGESIPDLTNRVRDLYEEFDRSRAEMIARSESIRASNQGSIETYIASGVVDRVMWIYAPVGSEKECEICGPLGGEVRELTSDGVAKDAFFKDEYGDGNSPPAHPNCRCCLTCVLEGETITDSGIE